MSRPNPDEKTIQHIEQLFSMFIWNKKPAKINTKLLIARSYEEGGLQMVNIANFINSLKLSWIIRFVCKQIPEKILRIFFCVNEIISQGPNNQGQSVLGRYHIGMDQIWKRFQPKV
jgi:hypothetical protein